MGKKLDALIAGEDIDLQDIADEYRRENPPCEQWEPWDLSNRCSVADAQSFALIFGNPSLDVYVAPGLDLSWQDFQALFTEEVYQNEQ